MSKNVSEYVGVSVSVVVGMLVSKGYCSLLSSWA